MKWAALWALRDGHLLALAVRQFHQGLVSSSYQLWRPYVILGFLLSGQARTAVGECSTPWTDSAGLRSIASGIVVRKP
jgi:hypothetical protein